MTSKIPARHIARVRPGRDRAPSRACGTATKLLLQLVSAEQNENPSYIIVLYGLPLESHGVPSLRWEFHLKKTS